MRDRPDYSRPSVLLEERGHTEWAWGVTHTVRPERLAPMRPDVEYSVTAKVQRVTTGGPADVTFAGLYARATAIADARCRDFARDDNGVRRWIICHAWRDLQAGGGVLAFAMVMMGMIRPAAGLTPPSGTAPPTSDELTASGGATMADLQRCSPQRATEVVVDFDHRPSAADGTAPFLYSYGERLSTDAVDSFEPFVRRAEESARAHRGVADALGVAPMPPNIVRREWYLIDRLVTVELQLRP